MKSKSLIKTEEYPQKFYSFKSGRIIEESQINKWIEEVISDIKKGDEYSYVSCGNTIVIGFNNGDEIEIIVSQDYKSKFVDSKR